MNRFYIPQVDLSIEKEFACIKNKEDISHISKSLRLKTGDAIEISSGENASFIAVITDIAKNEIALALKKQLDNTELNAHIDLFQGIPKGHKWDFLIQKSVECGVRDIYPIQMHRSVSIVKAEQLKKKQTRWQKIAEEAAKQSKRSYITQVKDISNLSEIQHHLASYDMVLTAYVGEKVTRIKALESEIKKARRIAICIGPEGGIDQDEIEILSRLGSTVSLGKRTLRTETAGLVMLARLSYIIEG